MLPQPRPQRPPPRSRFFRPAIRVLLSRDETPPATDGEVPASDQFRERDPRSKEADLPASEESAEGVTLADAHGD